MSARRWVVPVVAIVALVGITTACEWPVRPSFVVGSYGTEHDVAPGDGVCETAPGNDVCSLVAALDEVNALGVDTDLVVPSGAYPVTVNVTGRVRINAGGDARISVQGIEVAAGGQLLIDGLANFVQNTVRVNGVLLMRHSSLSRPGTGLEIGTTGVVALENVTVDGGFGSAIVNDGFLATRNVTIAVLGGSAGSGISTGPTATTRLESTLIAWRTAPPSFTSEPGPACLGSTPVSLGANATYDLSCGLGGPGDQVGTNPVVTWNLRFDDSLVVVPGYGSPVVDAIAPGTHECGTFLVDDQSHNPRPVDADGDPTTPAACDIGAVELP